MSSRHAVVSLSQREDVALITLSQICWTDSCTRRWPADSRGNCYIGVESRPHSRGAADGWLIMDVDRQVLHTGADSWEGTMTYQGITFMVEAMERTHQGAHVWAMEILRQTGRHTVQPLSHTYHPTLDAALECTERIILDLAGKGRP